MRFGLTAVFSARVYQNQGQELILQEAEMGAMRPIPDSPELIHVGPFRRLADAITAQLRQEIIRGNLKPGHWLKQEELATRFDASPIPVREALRALAAEGLVRLIPHRGAVVTELSAEDILEIYEIRAILEAHAARLGAPRLTDDQIRRLSDYLDQMEQPGADVVMIVEANRLFHGLIYEASGKEHLCNLINTLRNSTQHYLHAYIKVLGRMPEAQTYHRAILQACKEQDGETAAAATFEHLMRVGQTLADYVRMS